MLGLPQLFRAKIYVRSPGWGDIENESKTSFKEANTGPTSWGWGMDRHSWIILSRQEDKRANTLPVGSKIWSYVCKRCSAFDEASNGECSSQKDGSRAWPWDWGDERGRLKKVVRVQARVEMVALTQRCGLSSRRACALLNVSRSMLYYRHRQPCRDKALAKELRDLSKCYPRLGLQAYA